MICNVDALSVVVKEVSEFGFVVCCVDSTGKPWSMSLSILEISIIVIVNILMHIMNMVDVLTEHWKSYVIGPLLISM